MTTNTVKAYARERMLGNYGKAISALLTVAALRMIASGIIGTFFDSSSALMIILNLLASIIFELIGGILTAGLAYLFLKIMYGQTAFSADVFHAFREQPDKAVRIMLIFTLTAQLWEIPFLVLITPQAAAGPFFLLLALVGIVVYVLVWLTYAMAFYLLHDFPDRSAAELLVMSKELMRGNKMRFFKLMLSFLPMFLLGVIAFFIPLLWVSAYMQASQASFYRSLMLERRAAAQPQE